MSTKQKLTALARGAIGVDETNRVIRGAVVAQVGVFLEPDPRGQFTMESLRRIQQLMAADPLGLPSYLDHESIVESNLLRFLGRMKNPRIDGDKLRADLTFDKTASSLPALGDVASYLMQRTKSDPASLSTSLVLDQIEVDHNDRNHPPVWMPVKLSSSDVVSRGAAVKSILSPSASGTPRMNAYAQRLDDLDDAIGGERPRLDRFAQLLDTLNARTANMLLPKTPPSPPLPDTTPAVVAMGYVALWNVAAIGDNPPERLAFRRGCFRTTLAMRENVILRCDHRGMIGSLYDGTIRRLSEDHIGLRCELRLDPDDRHHAKAIARIRRGELAFSPGAVMLPPPPGRCTVRKGETTYLDRCALHEVSLTDCPRFAGTRIMLANGGIDMSDVLYRDRTQRDRRCAGAMRSLLKRRAALAC